MFILFYFQLSSTFLPHFGIDHPAKRHTYHVPRSSLSILISIMGSCRSPIKLDKDVPFIENDWIGLGKKYTEVPDFVRWKKDSDMELEIPFDFLQHMNFPEPELSVKEFLAFKDHIRACNKKSRKKHAAGTPSLFQLGWAKVTQAGKKKGESQQRQQLQLRKWKRARP